MKQEGFPLKPAILRFFLVFFSFLLISFQVLAADGPPTIIIDANPKAASPGDIVSLTATATDTDGTGVKYIYFYPPGGAPAITQDCGGTATCTKSITQIVNGLGTVTFCAKAIDTANLVSKDNCVDVEVTTDRPPIIKYFHAEPKEDVIPTVHVEGTIKLVIVAEDDSAVSKIFLKDVSAASIETHDCGNLKSCIFETKRTFNTQGVYTFCTWAIDNTGKNSVESCIDVHVISKYSCEMITVDDLSGEKPIALKLTTKRLHIDKDGLAGYSAQCCKEMGYCNDLRINTTTCGMIDGDFPASEYNVFQWDPNVGTLKDVLSSYTYPQVLCTTTLGGYTMVGVIDNAGFSAVGEVQNLEENTIKYWLVGAPGFSKLESSNILVYTSGGAGGLNDSLKDYLRKIGYPADLKDRSTPITKELLAPYGQVWFIQSSQISALTKEEVDAVVAYHDNGGNILLSGAGDVVGDIAKNFGVSFDSTLKTGSNACVKINIQPHAVITGVSSLSSAGSDSLLSSTNPLVKTIGSDASNPLIMALESEGGKGKVVFDSAITRFLTASQATQGAGGSGPDSCDNSRYIQNIVKWLDRGVSQQRVGETGSVDRKYFFAEQLQQEDNETKVTTIVDAQKYSDAVNALLKDDCIEKDLENGECQFPCNPPETVRCNPTAPCGSNNCLGCPYKRICECCPSCEKVLNYKECWYQKYEKMYGRPFVDYMFCWKIPGLRDTPWCYQKADQPTSTVNYPWYGFTRKEDGYYRTLESISEEYIDNIHKWNFNVEVREMPDKSSIPIKEWVPESYCDHNFEDKLFRNIWTKIFTVTPFLNDLRNNLTWTRSGPGALYAGGGFRREPSCWWECCRQCAPFCDCACVNGCSGQICCLMARFSPVSVHNVMEIMIPYTTVSEGSMQITYEADNTQATIDNGVINVISTGNQPFEVSASFSKDEANGKYTLTIDYTPIGGYSGNMDHNPERDLFMVAQDIVLKYDLNEDAPTLTPSIKETFSTTLIDKVCNCVCPLIDPVTLRCICPPGCGASASCCCCPTRTVTVETEESIEDSRGSKTAIDTIKIDALKLAANGFVDLAIDRGWMVGLVSYSQHPWCPAAICETHVLTTDRTPLHEQINSYQPHTGTCIACGINKAVGLFSAAKAGEKHIIVMSDGVPQCCLSTGGNMCPGGSQEMGEQEAIDQATAAKGKGITVHAVLMGTANRGETNPQFMKDLAAAGGGTYHEVTCDCGLECIYKKLVGIPLVKDNIVLVNDVTGSMREELSLECPGKGAPVIHQFGAINISIEGNIDNYLDSKMTTGVRSKGWLNIYASPDIISRFTFNVDESNIDYYSLVYPVKHDVFRKYFAHGSWHPGYPYVYDPEAMKYDPTIGADSYIFDDAYRYENVLYNYPDQCNQICPSDCRCPDNDITDVTCTDENGKDYKRTDCVCLPAAGHSFSTPCTSKRTFHEEEGYYYDFVDLETREVGGDINLMGKMGTNPQYTGNLKGEVLHNKENKTPTNPSGCQETLPEDWTLTENMILLPTDPKDAGAGDTQAEPLAVHGLAWRISECMITPSKCGFGDSDGIKIGRAIGPLQISGVSYNAGPYIVTAKDDPKKVVDKVISSYPEFKNVNYAALGTKTTGTVKVISVYPVKVCIKDGAWDTPSLLFNEMYIPYKKWDSSCLKEDDLIIFGCPEGPLSDATAENVRDFVSNCGTYIATDLAYEPLNQIFPGYIQGNGEGDTSAVLWEGEKKGSYDLPEDLKRFFQTPYETTTGWSLLPGTIVINGVNSETNVLAKGDYASGQTNKPMAVTFKYANRGRVFYYTVHVEGAAEINQKAFMSSFYTSAGSASRTTGEGGIQGTYRLDFEALNFPYSLIKYDGETWTNTLSTRDCTQVCKSRGLVTSENCTCPAGLAKACVYCKKNATAAGGDFCYGNCKATCPGDYKVDQCCCSKPSFKTDNSSLTVYIHFRDNKDEQTFNLFPPRIENKPYATVNINVTVRNPVRVICNAMPTNTGPNQEITVKATLLDALTGQGIPFEDVTITVDGYGLSDTRKTGTNGNRADFKFGVKNENTKVSCTYRGSKKYTENTDSTYVNVYTTDKIWWFISPEVLLLVIVMAVLAFSYKWFKGGKLDLHNLWDELRGKK